MFAGETLFEKRVSPAPLSEKLKNSFYNFSSGKCFCAGRLFEKRSLRALPPPSGKLKILFPTIKHVCQAKQTCFVFQAGRTCFVFRTIRICFVSFEQGARTLCFRTRRASVVLQRAAGFMEKLSPNAAGQTERKRRKHSPPPPPTNFITTSMSVLSPHISR